MAIVQLLISGISLGCIYALIALGFVLIYKATETVNFAQGELMMLGAFGGLVMMTIFGWSFWLAAPAAVACMFLMGIGLERAVIRPILGQPQFTVVMLTIGVGYTARGLISMIPEIGTETHTLPVPYAGQVMNLGGAVISLEQVAVIGMTAVLCLVLYLMFRYSKLGIAMQAASQNQLAAYYMGIPVRRINGLVWGLSAAVVGGFGSLPGAIVGGLVIGLVEAFAGFYLPEGFKDIAAYVVVLIMLVVKPNGLFGGAMRKKV